MDLQDGADEDEVKISELVVGVLVVVSIGSGICQCCRRGGRRQSVWPNVVGAGSWSCRRCCGGILLVVVFRYVNCSSLSLVIDFVIFALVVP